MGLTGQTSLMNTFWTDCEEEAMGKRETGNALLTDMNHEQAYFQEVTDEVAKTTKDLEKQVKSNKEDVEELLLRRETPMI